MPAYIPATECVSLPAALPFRAAPIPRGSNGGWVILFSGTHSYSEEYPITCYVPPEDEPSPLIENTNQYTMGHTY